MNWMLDAVVTAFWGLFFIATAIGMWRHLGTPVAAREEAEQ